MNLGNSIVTLPVCTCLCFFHCRMCRLQSGSVVACQPCMRDIEGSIPEGLGFFSFSQFSISLCINAFEKKEHYNY